MVLYSPEGHIIHCVSDDLPQPGNVLFIFIFVGIDVCALSHYSSKYNLMSGWL